MAPKVKKVGDLVQIGREHEVMERQEKEAKKTDYLLKAYQQKPTFNQIVKGFFYRYIPEYLETTDAKTTNTLSQAIAIKMEACDKIQNSNHQHQGKL